MVKQAALLEGAMWQGTGQHLDNSQKGNEILGPAAHKELNPARKPRVDLEVSPPQLEPGEDGSLGNTVGSASWETFSQGHMGKPCLDSRSTETGRQSV